ncbi:MAG: hypothetical protein GXO47_12635 [Chlorobi bacterium]|nr:hypothetical protein [Chlorobiota bacterium]
MKTTSISLLSSFFLFLATAFISAQEEETKIKFSGELKTDQRFLYQSPNSWAWNENRLTFRLSKKFRNDKGKFHTEVWLRNIGLPEITTSSDLYNKGIVDPYNLEIREAYVQLYGFLSKNLDIKIGRQRIAWGTADLINPTDNLNPYDLEDVLDFGRHRGSDAISFDYYFTPSFSLHGTYIPIFQPANMPVGVFADALSPEIVLPPPYHLENLNDNIDMPKYTLGESSTAGIKLKGFAAGIDLSLSYVWGRDGFPTPSYNTISPGDNPGGLNLDIQSTYFRQSIFGFDMATSIAGVGLWAEAAGFLPEKEQVMTTDMTPMFPGSPVPVTRDSIVLKKEMFFKYVIGADYNFANGMYLNVQFLHGFVNERGRENLNDYFFIQYEKRFFDDRLKTEPLQGAFIVSDWNNVKDNYALIYSPEISFMATDNAEITISSAIFAGKGNNPFAKFADYDMFLFGFKYSF